MKKTTLCSIFLSIDAVHRGFYFMSILKLVEVIRYQTGLMNSIDALGCSAPHTLKGVSTYPCMPTFPNVQKTHFNTTRVF